tara:strand:+ start:145 stop:438 length:294 start_codon:yes stop_codon:yes gene_type:complete
MNKQQLQEIVRGELKEMIGIDTEPVPVPSEIADHIQTMLIAMTETTIGELNLALEKSGNKTLTANLEKAKKKYTDGVQEALIILMDLLEMEKNVGGA